MIEIKPKNVHQFRRALVKLLLYVVSMFGILNGKVELDRAEAAYNAIYPESRPAGNVGRTPVATRV